MARASCGNLEEFNKYWKKDEDRVCQLCERGYGTIKHLLEDCEQIERTGYNIAQQVLDGRTNEKVVK